METKYIVNNATGQTINGDITINGGLTITGDTSIRPYKVYTALLTQSGGDDFQDIISGNLTVGVTYQIFDDGGFSGDCDFTNVGAPNNDLGTYFVATGTTPNSWGTNTGLLYNTGAPVVTVLENTIGNIWFTYDGVGSYRVNSNGLFTTNKSIGFTNNWYADGYDNYLIYDFNIYSPDAVRISTTRISNPDNPNDDKLNNTPIEIRVYN